ncbi:ABC transporter permease [Agrococcus sp. SGAir0287]|uniref:ABC transporter permease n=1 Tax=Agrococcus sp. SGAir0287 TaxID=2070347 RepID=UPI0010CD093A|nr:ABC transporter permease [Agrococcus sp. SGAir0287]QCR18450.1 ABC transporter permease [Agrococcus sp. SGAir0287]
MTTIETRDRPRRTTWQGYLLVAPAVAVIVLLVVVPTVIVARESFAIPDPLGGTLGGFTLDNYATLLDPVYLKTIGYSLGMAAANAVVCLVVGYVVATWIAAARPERQPLLLLLVIIPFWTDFLVRTFAWINILGSGGIVVTALRAVGIQAESFVPSQGAVVLSLLYAFLPVAVFPIYASLRSIDPSLPEAATDLGCSWWQTQRRVILPLAAPGIAAAVMLTFVPTLGVFVIPVLLGGGLDPLVGNLIVTLFTEFRNQALGSAMAMVVLVLMLASVAIAGIAMRIAASRRSSS